MIFPVGTDAPIYHRPIVTIGLIVVNVAAFFFSMSEFGDEDWEQYQLAVGILAQLAGVRQPRQHLGRQILKSRDAGKRGGVGRQLLGHNYKLV